MFYRANWEGYRAYIGCGLALVILGLVLLLPIVGWLIKALGWAAIVAGLIAVALGSPVLGLRLPQPLPIAGAVLPAQLDKALHLYQNLE